MSDDRELTPAEIAKFEAEARKADAETRRIEQEIDAAKAKTEREARESDVKVRKVEAELAIAKEGLVQASYATRNMDRVEKEMLAEDKFNHVYYFNSTVGETSVRSCMNRLSYWNRVSPGCDIEIIFNSPGGSVIDGLALFDYIQELKRSGHHVTTKALGMAASMAGILTQAGTERVMAKESWMLIHEISTLAVGKIGDIEDEVKFVKRIQERVLTIFAEGCAKAHAANPTVATKPFSMASLRKGWNRKDWWLDSDECLMHGIVDRVS